MQQETDTSADNIVGNNMWPVHLDDDEEGDGDDEGDGAMVSDFCLAFHGSSCWLFLTVDRVRSLVPRLSPTQCERSPLPTPVSMEALRSPRL
jgi:hypothetical protein